MMFIRDKKIETTGTERVRIKKLRKSRTRERHYHGITKRKTEIHGRQIEKEIRTYDLLDKLGVAYERVDHEAAMSNGGLPEIDTEQQATI